jgi:predicted dehydrogenase
MWAEEAGNMKDGTNDVEDLITGYVRTDKASISFIGSWAENNGESECYVDILGDKNGARLSYGGQFKFYDGQTLETTTSDIKIGNIFANEDLAFLKATRTGEHTKTHVDNVLETMKLLETLYKSADAKQEIRF